jgi:hypothetical protein
VDGVGSGKCGVGVRRGVFGTLLGPEITGLLFCVAFVLCSVVSVFDWCPGWGVGVVVGWGFVLFLVVPAHAVSGPVRGRVWV